MTALDLPWMFNSFLQFLRRKLNAHCVWRQSIISRLCRVFTHSASSVLTKHANFARRQLQATIKCPVCQTSFQIPEGDSFKNLPASYHLNRLVDVLALKDSGAQAQKCSSCEENNTASAYCFVCQIFLCTSCFEAHQRLKTGAPNENIVQNH